jgi:hypothetical protein
MQHVILNIIYLPQVFLLVHVQYVIVASVRDPPGIVSILLRGYD